MARQTRLEQTRPTGHGRARGLVSDRHSGSRVEACTYAPCAELTDVVATLWKGSWDLRGQPPHETELLGDPCVHLVIEQSGGASSGSRLVGVWTKLWRRTLQERGRVFGVKLRSGAARAFIEQPASGYSNRKLPLGEVLDGVAELEEQVLSAADDACAFSCFQAWLQARRRPDSDGRVSLAVALVERVVRDEEILTVAQLAAVAGMGTRALQRIFREHVGASPKWVIRRHRLQEAALRIERGEAPTLAALAASLGYADQAHLARDFKAAVGKSPSAFERAMQSTS